MQQVLGYKEVEESRSQVVKSMLTQYLCAESFYLVSKAFFFRDAQLNLLLLNFKPAAR